MPGLDCTSLEELRALIGECTRCGLAATRTKLVFGVGDPHARVMLIGEAPGRNEDLKGEPFVGAAGGLLDELLGHAGLARDEVYIANVLKCRPPENRDPQAEEIETCTPFLREQIRVIDPEVLVTLGNFATRFVLKTSAGITGLRGTIQHAGRFTVLPIFHPAAAIYDRTKHDTLIRDFMLLREILDEVRPTAPDRAEHSSHGDESPTQEQLF
jgi:DNA polymerase